FMTAPTPRHALGSPHCRDDERFIVVAGCRPVRPALGDDLVLGPETHPFLTILADVAEARALPAAEAVIADRHRNRHIDAAHAYIHPRREFAGGVAVASEDGDAIAIFVLGRQAQRLLEIARPDHLQDGAEDFLLVGLVVRLDVIEE